MALTSEVEVCVIGGGPAGATIAQRLASLGHDVCLIERCAFPRQHIGESLPPGILPLLDFTGLRQRIEQASFLRPEGAIVRWAGVQRQLDFTAGAPGFQVDRGRFDQLLLEAARDAGVRIIQPAHAGRPRVAGTQWHIPVRSEGDLSTVRANFLVDASGRRMALAGKKRKTAKPTLAIYAYWRNVRLEGAETRVEAGENEWFWGAPLPDRTFNATVFVDPSRGRANGDLENLYCSLLSSSSLLRGCLDGELAGPVSACDATTYYVEEPVTPCSIKVGEASLAIDPLSSQGVQAAIASAVQGSIVAHTLLTCPDNTSAAMRFYRERQTETAEFHKRTATQFYVEQDSLSHRSFWHERARDISFEATQSAFRVPRATFEQGPGVFNEDRRFRVSPAVRLEELPCISGNTIRNATTIAHPFLERPVAFIKDIEIAPLLSLIDSEKSGTEIVRLWSGVASRRTLGEILQWMCGAGILVQLNE